MTRRIVRRLGELAQSLLGRRQVGSVGEADQRHFGGGERARRIVHVVKTLEQNLPGPRQRAHRQLAGEFAALLALALADRRVVGRVGRDLDLGDVVADLRDFEQDVGRIRAGVIERAHQFERLGDLALHRPLEQGDDLAPVGKAEHVADGERGHAAGPAVGDGLIEQRQGVAHRALGDAGDDGERLRLRRNALEAGDLLQVPDHQARLDPLQVEADAARAHRDRHLLDLGRGEQEFYVLGRLLERLQERVEGLLRQHVHFVDDVDLGAGRDRAIARVFDDLPHVVDAGVRGSVHLDHVDVARIHDRLAVRAELRHVDARPVDLARNAIVQRAGENARGRRLAGAADAGENIGLMDAVDGEGIGDRPDHRLLADQVLEALRPVFSRENPVGRGGRARAGRHGASAGNSESLIGRFYRPVRIDRKEASNSWGPRPRGPKRSRTRRWEVGQRPALSR